MNTGAETDERLVELAREGDPAAFGILVLRYRRKLLRYIEPFVFNASEAEDIVQEAFLSAFKALCSFRGDSTFSTWLYRIAINKAKNLRMQSFRRLPPNTRESDEVTQDLHSEGVVIDTPESIFERDELLKIVSSALDLMPSEQREAFLLLELDGLSYDQIAVSMKSPVGTVRSRVHRARDFLASVLKNSHYSM
jgi:RNA polymerase sigma-70 factor (ECF subfamily)